MTSPTSGKKMKKNVACTKDRFVLADFFPSTRYCAQCYNAQPNHLGTQEKKIVARLTKVVPRVNNSHRP